MKDEDAETLSPPPLIDQVWHLHLLDTRSYQHDLNVLCERLKIAPAIFIHHEPDGALDAQKREQRLQNTIMCYQAAYGSKPDATYWVARSLPRMQQAAGSAETVVSNPLKRARTSDNEETIIIMIPGNKSCSGAFRLRKDATVSSLMHAFCQKSGWHTYMDHTSCLFKGRKLNPEHTLSQAGLTDGDTVYVAVRFDAVKQSNPISSSAQSGATASNPAKNAHIVDTIAVKVVGENNNSAIIHVKKDAPFSTVQKVFCDKFGLSEGSMNFLFDGECLRPDYTISQHQLQNGDVIDALVKQVGC